MTNATHLFRGNDKGEILDADGKVVGRIVPVEPTEAMNTNGASAYENALDDGARWQRAAMYCYRAMLSAAPADWSSVAVRVPEPQIDKRIFDTEDQKAAWTDGWLSAIFALDAIKGAT